MNKKLSPTDTRVLGIMRNHAPSPVTSAHIAQGLQSSVSHANIYLNRLKETGHVTIKSQQKQPFTWKLKNILRK
jgi:DNA-binding transcriptional regulator LsrR (DeoR family)